MTHDELRHLVLSLAAQSHETEWLEFKHNNADPQQIGENISAQHTNYDNSDR